MRAKLIADGVIGSNAYVVIAGPANTYSHYVIIFSFNSILLFIDYFVERSRPVRNTPSNAMRAPPLFSDNVRYPFLLQCPSYLNLIYSE